MVGAPGYRDSSSNYAKGRVYAIDLNANHTVHFTVTGNEKIAEFGHAIAVNSKGLTAVSSPASGTMFTLHSGDINVFDFGNVSTIAQGTDFIMGS